MTETVTNIAQLASDLIAFFPVTLNLSQVINDRTSSTETIFEII